MEERHADGRRAPRKRGGRKMVIDSCAAAAGKCFRSPGSRSSYDRPAHPQPPAKPWLGTEIERVRAPRSSGRPAAGL